MTNYDDIEAFDKAIDQALGESAGEDSNAH
jgi:hypothetical protein